MNNQKDNFLFYKPEFDLERAKLENFLRTFEEKGISSNEYLEHENKKYMIELVNKKIIFNFF